jgi:hypothetical protein
MFIIFNNNINDTFIKINIVDIIAKVFSKNLHTEEINFEICNLLKNLVMNENNVEVSSHVLNAFFDIWAEDYYNQNLIKGNIIELMKQGLPQFRSKVYSHIIPRFKQHIRVMRLTVRYIHMQRRPLQTLNDSLNIKRICLKSRI